MEKSIGNKTDSTARLWVLQARDVPRAVILRRSPSREVLVLLWDTAKDTFYAGQWFKGRIHEPRCDISPDGRRFLYFAGKNKPPFPYWTAVSRPPFLTAIALWPSFDVSSGGGYFASENEVLQEYGDDWPPMAEGFTLPMEATEGSWRNRHRDDFPHKLYPKNPWTWHKHGHFPKPWLHTPIRIKYASTHVWTRQNPIASRKCELVCTGTLNSIQQFGQAGQQRNIAVRGTNGVETPLGITEWADWTNNGDFVFAREGCLWRLGWSGKHLMPMANARLLLDFNPMVFEAKIAPDGAKTWNQDFDLEPYRIPTP